MLESVFCGGRAYRPLDIFPFEGGLGQPARLFCADLAVRQTVSSLVGVVVAGLLSLGGGASGSLADCEDANGLLARRAIANS